MPSMPFQSRRVSLRIDTAQHDLNFPVRVSKFCNESNCRKTVWKYSELIRYFLCKLFSVFLREQDSWCFRSTVHCNGWCGTLSLYLRPSDEIRHLRLGLHCSSTPFLLSSWCRSSYFELQIKNIKVGTNEFLLFKFCFTSQHSHETSETKQKTFLVTAHIFRKRENLWCFIVEPSQKHLMITSSKVFESLSSRMMLHLTLHLGISVSFLCSHH